MIRIGTAGWALPRAVADAFAGDGTRLERYARVLSCVEINSSFHRPHRVSTYARWAESVPAGFRFSVKVPKAITHVARLQDVGEPLARFLDEACALGGRLGAVLVQLAPSLAIDPPVVDDFFGRLRERYAGPVVCEPRHATWFDDQADALLVRHRVTRVAADPAKLPAAASPGGWLGAGDDAPPSIVYFRWHGSPQVYRSAYDDAWLAERAGELARWSGRNEVWCIFDNTTLGAATDDALRLDRLVRRLSLERLE